MVSSFTQTIIAILLIPCIPLLIYVIGILIPESHIVSRTTTYKTRPERLWQLLTEVEHYPVWRPKLESVSIDSITPATLGEGKRVVFVEHSKRDRRTVILHVEQQPLKTMLRVLEERITTAVSLRSPVPTRPHVPTFSGSWTFELKYQKWLTPTSNDFNGNHDSNHSNNNETPKIVQLKITEQGVIKKPLVRLSNMLLFGYYRRIDRFMKDLEKRIEQDHHDNNATSLNTMATSNNTTTTTAITTTTTATISSNSTMTTTGENITHQVSADKLNNCNEANQQDATLMLSNKAGNQQDYEDAYSPTDERRSSSSSKDWDLVSEIYERQRV